ncbi:cytochrome c1 [Elongatibacter sediminis]|uniref:Cytochrome c1 n=1 Tax=Elongatibacter sediminis TaxID=3119006 RepID=A0AAW9RF28_9GAMM
MKRKLATTVFALAVGLIAQTASAASEGGGHLQHAGVNARDVAAVQRGAKWFVNYCLSCHSAQYMRYNRLVEDLGLSEDQVMNNLVFSDAKIGETMDIAMRPEQATAWLGKAPPDLSLSARSRGTDWLYTYLLTFYQDESGGWNNLMLPNASMPHVLWQLQGIQKPVYAEHGDEAVVDHLVVDTPGLQTPEEYAQTARDIATFLDYLSEPAKLQRKSIGIWVMLFLAAFALVAYALKAEYWRDVH